MRVLVSWIAFMIMLTGLNSLSAQTKRQFLQAADVAYAQKNYHAALTYYKTVADAWPDETNVQYLTAEAARAYNSYLLAEKHYQLVIDQDAGATFPDAALHLAGVKQNLAKYDEAIKLYRLYDSWRADKSQNSQAQIANCEFAKEAITRKVDVELVNIGINTEFSEFAPVKIGDTLYYSSLNFPLEQEDVDSKILLSRIYETGNDEISQLLRMQMVEGNKHIAHTAFDEDLDRMFYSICHNVNVTDYHCDLFYTEKTDLGWSAAKRLPEVINVPGYSSSQPAFARMADGREYLLYTSDAPGGRGKMDIWRSELLQDGTFGRPENLSAVNTVEGDITPFFHSPSQTMYFSSEGHMNLGGFDIYSIKFTENGWGEIVHVPMPYNSSYNDIYFVTSDDGEYIYLASNRESGGAKYIDPELQACCNDIYRAIDKHPIMLVANGFNSVDQLPLPGTQLSLYTKINGEWILVETKVDPATHRQEFPLDRMHLYRVIGEKPGFLPDTLEFDTYDLTIIGPLTKDLFLTPEKLQLEVFTFDMETRAPLAECSVRLLDVTDPMTPVLIKRLDNPTANDFLFGIRPDRKYRLEAQRVGYIDTLATFDSYVIPPNAKIRQDLYLRRMELPDMIPVRVYFDNDIPGRRMFTKSTRERYDETLVPYLARKDEYIQNYMDDLPLEEKDILRERMTDFFKDSVSRGMRQLEIFCESLLEDLKEGNTVTVTRKAIAVHVQHPDITGCWDIGEQSVFATI
ncbi:MAG: PD40 domain-containing protein [Saprospiraceae bacterium]|nr:PD40 domain-containing protein [Saprospiraceae bacterium]